MIQVNITYKDGQKHLVAGNSPRSIAGRVETVMWKDMPHIANIEVHAPGEAAAEGARLKHLFKGIDLDIRINQSMERTGLMEFDLYEIAKHPRRRTAC